MRATLESGVLRLQYTADGQEWPLLRLCPFPGSAHHTGLAHLGELPLKMIRDSNVLMTATPVPVGGAADNPPAPALS